MKQLRQWTNIYQQIPEFYNLISFNDFKDKINVEIGIEETPQNLSNKISRGAFGADFMLQVLTAIGCEQIKI